jgi:uncharacterized protein with FMN-binding domain
MVGWIIAFVVVAGLGTAGAIGWSKLMKEHDEARNLPIAAIEFDKLKEGSFHGAYAGGMYKWRTNECQVTVTGGKVTKIELLNSAESANQNTMHESVYDRVIQAQSLQVDTISGATLTTKAYLKGVESALLQAR